MGKFDHLIGTELARGTWTWSSDDALLYAIGVGAGLEDGTKELHFTTENTEGQPQQVIPTFLTLASTGNQPWLKPLGFREQVWDGVGTGWPEGMVHGDQAVTLFRPIQPGGTADVSLVLAGVYDKGSGALVVVDSKVTLADSGEVLGTARAGYFIRAQGGFGGPRGPAEEQPWVKMDRGPDLTVTQVSSPGQALIYRLSRDRNPHCTDPAKARADGFPRPIFQGLGTFGFACRALLEGLCDGDARRYRAMYARLSQPVFPGDTLKTAIWRTDRGAQFQMYTPDGRMVLDRGTFTFAA
jgi:acyl dehydratase